MNDASDRAETDQRDEASLTQALRDTRPNRVRVVDTDGQARDVACATGKAARHAMTARTILGLGLRLERVELCDPKGAILAVWRPSSEPETQSDSLPIPGGTEQADRDLYIARMMVDSNQRAADHATDRLMKQLTPVFQGYREIVQGLTQRNAHLEKQQSQTLKLAYEAVRFRAQAEVALNAVNEQLQNPQQMDPADAAMAALVDHLTGKGDAGNGAQSPQGNGHAPPAGSDL